MGTYMAVLHTQLGSSYYSAQQSMDAQEGKIWDHLNRFPFPLSPTTHHASLVTSSPFRHPQIGVNTTMDNRVKELLRQIGGQASGGQEKIKREQSPTWLL
ncbi:UNVERIFIED_CONTAM: hypothetical protein K2H54_057849 [Gekko kuhli]